MCLGSTILVIKCLAKYALNSPENRFPRSPASMLCLEKLALPSIFKNYLTTLKMGERGYIYHIHDFLPRLSARIVWILRDLVIFQRLFKLCIILGRISCLPLDLWFHTIFNADIVELKKKLGGLGQIQGFFYKK